VTVTATTNDATNPSRVRLLEKSLVTGLLPGASVSFEVPGIAAATGRTTNSLSVDLSVLGDPSWLEVQSAAGAWSWAAERDGRANAAAAARDRPTR
jgi:hypothetical protein